MGERMKYMRFIMAMSLGLSLSSRANGLVIQSFNGITGHMTFNELTTATTYRVEWKNSLTSGVWQTGSPGVTGITASGFGQNGATVGINATSCFYRVVAEVTNAPLYLIIDVSGGPAATNYPVNSMMAAPSMGWTDNYRTTNIVLRRIPAGTFTMGSPTNELGRNSLNETQHQVTLSRDFYICVFQVTQKQWERVMGNWPSYFNNASYREGRPVEQVSYKDIRGASAGTNWPAANSVDASSFIGKLRMRTGMTFDLPTEAQWEYACRGGTTTALNSGYNITNIASDAHMMVAGRYWSNGGSSYTQNGDISVGTAKTGIYLPNAWGLYDLHGNVWEWCLDWYNDAYPGTVTDPKGASSGTDRVSRGGSWTNPASACRSAMRNWLTPDTLFLNFGFRFTVPLGT